MRQIRIIFGIFARAGIMDFDIIVLNFVAYYEKEGNEK